MRSHHDWREDICRAGGATTGRLATFAPRDYSFFDDGDPRADLDVVGPKLDGSHVWRGCFIVGKSNRGRA
jgi:hypothetical protein